jgi:predicted site-specific integrase-resolvase
MLSRDFVPMPHDRADLGGREGAGGCVSSPAGAARESDHQMCIPLAHLEVLMANALIVKETLLPASRKNQRAAQYVRMSTELQRYSIENQAATIAAYAQAHDLSIVRTYRDEGLSGLRLKNRRGLIRLLEDVQSGRADFGHILVYDVSRWGRFQDVDESAHHEFTCKKAGIKVAYCAEQFDNDGSLMASIVKNINRRELGGDGQGAGTRTDS